MASLTLRRSTRVCLWCRPLRRRRRATRAPSWSSPSGHSYSPPRSLHWVRHVVSFVNVFMLVFERLYLRVIVCHFAFVCL